MTRRTKIGLFLTDNTIWVIFAILFIGCSFKIPQFFTYGNLINILHHSTPMAMLVLGEGLCLMSGNFDLSIESTLGFAPAIAALMATRWIPGINPSVYIIMTFVVGASIGLFNGYFITKIGINPFLQTLSMLIILRGITYYFIPLSLYDLPRSYTFVGHTRVIGQIPIGLFIAFVVFFLIYILLKKTIFGRSILSVGGNPIASYAAGINIDRVTIVAFILSGLLASGGGFLLAGRQACVTNNMGLNMVMLAFAGTVLGGVSLRGGRGTTLGMLGGVLTLGIIDNSLTLGGVNAYLVYASKGLLIFVAVVVDRSRPAIRRYLFYKEEVEMLRKEIIKTENQHRKR